MQNVHLKVSTKIDNDRLSWYVLSHHTKLFFIIIEPCTKNKFSVKK